MIVHIGMAIAIVKWKKRENLLLAISYLLLVSRIISIAINE